jgi:allantoinase
MKVFRGQRVVFPDGERPASIHVEHGTIVAIADVADLPEGSEVIDCGALVISPGVIDPHVHVNEPGRTDWEGFETATRAAAAGGVTSIVDMPLNSIPATTTVAALDAKRQALRRRSGQGATDARVDVSFWGGVVPGNEADLEPLIDAGVRGFKCFLVPSGVDEFAAADEKTLRRAMPVLARRGVPLLVHAELPQWLRPHSGSLARYRDYEDTRPPEAELRAIELMAMLSRETGARVHIVHVSSASGVEALAEARAEGIAITGETCPHYLSIADSEIPDGATEFKCAPPIRTAADRDALWRGLQTGTLSLIASDHSPAPPSLKPRGDFIGAWGGIASLELSLPVVWTAAEARGCSLVDVARWMSSGPAALAAFTDRGAVAVGMAADFAVWDPEGTFVVTPERLHQRHKLTPYAGRTLRGIVHATYLRGERVWQA